MYQPSLFPRAQNFRVINIHRLCLLTPPRCWRIVDPINIEWTPRIWADKGLNELLKLKRGEPSPLKTLICFNNPDSSARIEASSPPAAERWRRPGEARARGGAGGFLRYVCVCACVRAHKRHKREHLAARFYTCMLEGVTYTARLM